jgi:hypothetical protein
MSDNLIAALLGGGITGIFTILGIFAANYLNQRKENRNRQLLVEDESIKRCRQVLEKRFKHIENILEKCSKELSLMIRKSDNSEIDEWDNIRYILHFYTENLEAFELIMELDPQINALSDSYLTEVWEKTKKEWEIIVRNFDKLKKIKDVDIKVQELIKNDIVIHSKKFIVHNTDFYQHFDEIRSQSDEYYRNEKKVKNQKWKWEKWTSFLHKMIDYYDNFFDL